MQKQTYQNHIRFYPPHHFVFYPIATICTILSGWQVFHSEGNASIWLAITSLFVLLIALSFMMRQHYALMNQDRIVRLELRLRYYQLTSKRLEPIEQQLSFGQLKALRFASDEELIDLIQEAINKNLSPDAIKRSIKNWLPDNDRV